MATGIRVLVVLGALMGSAGCLVGPQDDFPDQPGTQDRDNGDNPAAGADGDDTGGAGVDGDFAAEDDTDDPDSEGGELRDEVMPRVVPPELPPIPPPSSDFGLERSDDPAPPATDTTDDPGN